MYYVVRPGGFHDVAEASGASSSAERILQSGANTMENGDHDFAVWFLILSARIPPQLEDLAVL